jgi:hypothetical protein
MFVSRVINLTQTHDQKMNGLKELSEFVLKYDWSPFTFKDSYRHNTSWASCDVMVLDIDSGCTIEEAKELFKQYTYLLTTSKSHQIEKNGVVADRFRIIIPLSSTIRDREIYKNTWYTLANKFPFIDQQCKDFARFYYRSKDYVCENQALSLDPVLENVMPVYFERPRMELMLTKGKLSRGTMEFIVNGAPAGTRNSAAFKAAKDFQEQGYTEEEAIDKLSKSSCVDDEFNENELERTIRSAYLNDPKYDPRGLSEKSEYVAMSAADLEDDPDLYKRNDPIRGPDFFDCTEEKWRKGDVLGVVAGSGTGKSAVSMKIIQQIINNNNQNDDIHFFFSLEMPARQVVKRWTKLVGKNSLASKRLYVVDNKNADERITWQHIVKFVEDTCKREGKRPGAIIIDHFMALSDKIDITKEPHFDVSTDLNSGRGKIKTIHVKEMCRLMKVVAEHLNCFLIIQNQSTIERAGHGDTPMGINAAYGAAQFAWFCDYILTVWQPLKRVQSETFLTATGWQYSKIREVGAEDATRVYTRHHLYYDLHIGDFRPLNELEEDEFNKMVEKANQLRKADDKKEATQYQKSPKGRANFERILTLAKGKSDER